MEEQHVQTINAAVNLKLLDRSEFHNVIVDSTVQPKAVAHPTENRMLETACPKLVACSERYG